MKLVKPRQVMAEKVKLVKPRQTMVEKAEEVKLYRLLRLAGRSTSLLFVPL